MESNYNRRSASSGSRRTARSTTPSNRQSRSRTATGSASGSSAQRSSRSSQRAASARRTRNANRADRYAPAARSYRERTVRSSEPATYRATPGGQYGNSARSSGRIASGREDGRRLESVSIGQLKREQRNERVQRGARNYAARIIAMLAVAIVLVIAGGVVYNSSLFTIENVEITGVEHLTENDMALMADIPEGSTLLRIDVDTIKKRLMQNAWVQDVSVNRVFPSTLSISVTERTITAVVEVPTSTGRSTKEWAISSDHMWLMPIPARDSEAGQNTSEQIYTDAENALRITNVPYGTQTQIGAVCTDSNVLNALDIVAGMTTELSGMVVEVSAAGPDETTLMLSNGVEVAFGKAENIRDKERVILKILADNPDSVAYINVRSVTNPTWRTV